MTDIDITPFPNSGFARGSIVREFGSGPNMLVIRSIRGHTFVVVCEGDEDGRRTDSAACTECMRENSRRRHAAIRADPVRWEDELARHRSGGGA